MADHKHRQFLKLRENYPVFTYHSFDIRRGPKLLELSFHFQLGSQYHFYPKWRIELGKNIPMKGEAELDEWWVFNLGMVEMISYWKAACPPRIHLHPFFLSKNQEAWWKKLFRHGLGEFFHTNGLPEPQSDIFSFSYAKGAAPAGGPVPGGFSAQGPATTRLAASAKNSGPGIGMAPGTGSGAAPGPHSGVQPESGSGMPQVPDFSKADGAGPGMSSSVTRESGGGVLVPLGGGKDSVVGMELLKQMGCKIIPFVVNPRGATEEVMRVAGFSREDSIFMHRAIDPMLLELNAAGFLNGHTPFSAMLAFASSFVASKAGIRYIVLSNESSANEPNIPGTQINHQYSKSFEFEQDFRSYLANCLDPAVNYFSLLRPLNELQIAGLFSSLKSYHGVFKSCNAGSKTDSWCGQCPKCLFTFIILSVFLHRAEVIRIFGKDLLDDPSLWSQLQGLCGLAPEKPFECVGSLEEVNLALGHVIEHMQEEKAPLPVLLDLYEKESSKLQRVSGAISRSLMDFDERNFLPGWMKDHLLGSLPAITASLNKT